MTSSSIFSRAWVPVDLMGKAFSRIVKLFPFSHAMDAVRNVMLHGTGFADVLTDFLWGAAYAIAFLLFGVWAFGRKTLGR